MSKQLGRNQNLTDESIISDGITLNASTTTLIAPANPKRIAFHVNSDGSNQAAWIKLQAASVDDDKKGIYLEKPVQGINQWDMSADNIYTGEISAIADSGSPTVFVTEY